MSTAEIIAELPRLTPVELAAVRATVDTLTAQVSDVETDNPPAVNPAIGMWKDRADLPADPVDASKVLREQLMHRTEPNGS